MVSDASERTETEVVVAVRDLSRDFPGVRALDGVSLDFRRGEIHAVIGENGAGKSTLMKIIAGVQPPSAGSVYIGGEAVTRFHPARAEAAGVVMVHQELNLVGELSVAANIFLGRELRRGWRLDHARMQREAAEWLARVGASCQPEQRVGDLGIAERQLVEIAKALAREARLLILDEPSAVLGRQEVARLHALVRRLRAEGVAVLAITHHLHEVQALADRISVLRDGRLVRSLAAAEVPAGQAGERFLASLMVGRELGEHFPARVASGEEVALAVTELTVPGRVEQCTLNVHRGEILGLAGLIGAGRSESAEAIAGFRPRAGTVRVNGHAVPPGDPRAALRAGIAYVSEDRRGSGLVLEQSIRHNATLAALARYCRRGFVDRRAEAEAVASLRERLDIRMADAEAAVGTLSGGNQQKVAIGKWLLTEPTVLLLDEPTRGVDIGAKEEIYAVVRDLASAGMACLCISSELTELLGLCHRIAVMHRGRLVSVLDATATDEEELIAWASGLDPAAEVEA